MPSCRRFSKFHMSKQQNSPSSGASRHLLPRGEGYNRLLPRRSCHEVTDEVKFHGLMLPTAVCEHTALRDGSWCNCSEFHMCERQDSPSSGALRHLRPRAKATIGFSLRRSCHGVTDEVKFCGLMSFLVRHCVWRHASCRRFSEFDVS